MSVRLMHSADAHIDSGHHGRDIAGSRINSAWMSNFECGLHIARTARDKAVDAMVWAGDAFRDSRPPAEAYLMFRQIVETTAAAGIPTILLRGNHEILGTWRPGHRSPIALYSDIPNVLVVEEPGLLRLGSGLQIAALPWLSRAQVLAEQRVEGLTPSESDDRIAAYLAEALYTMAEQADPSAPLLMAGHVTVEDVRLGLAGRGSERDLTTVFNEPILPRDVIDELPFSYAALGHIHDRQRIGSKCFYSGSPNRLTKTDAGKDKGANIVTIGDRNTLHDVQLEPTPARAMAVIDLASPSASAQLDALTPDTLTWITLQPGERELPRAVRTAIDTTGAQLVGVKPTPVAVRDRPRPTLPETADPADALRGYLDSRGIAAAGQQPYLDLAATLASA